MNLPEAYTLYQQTPDWDKQDYKVAVERAFAAGWAAKVEADKQGSFDLDVIDEYGVNTVEDIYAAYPRKVGRQQALQAIKKASKVKTRFELLKATKAYATATATWPEADKKFIPHPATWFNRGSYDDSPSEWVRGTPAPVSQFSRCH